MCNCKVEDGEGLNTYSLKSAMDVTHINVRQICKM
jgi:hypothetical protein